MLPTTPSPSPHKVSENKKSPPYFFLSDRTTRPAYTLGTTPIVRLFLITLNQHTPQKTLAKFSEPNKFREKNWNPKISFAHLRHLTLDNYIWSTPNKLSLRWLDQVILWGYHPTLKLSGIPTFTFIIGLTHRTDNIWINLQYNIKFLAIGVNVTWL